MNRTKIKISAIQIGKNQKIVKTETAIEISKNTKNIGLMRLKVTNIMNLLDKIDLYTWY